MTIFSTIALSGLVAFTAPEKHSFVIVHGAWQAPYAWQTVKAQLEQKGNTVVLVELPGHGSDHTPPQDLSIDVYSNAVLSAMKGIDGKVVLVGHSLAGVVIANVAEKAPEKIDKLIFIGAYIPTNGKSLLDLANTDKQSLLGPALVPSADKLTLGVPKEKLVNIFSADASPEVQQQVLDNYQPEPAIPFTNPLTITAARFGSVDKYYIHTAEDHVIGIDLQNQMAADAGIKHIYTLKSSHTPFLSMPDKVTGLLIRIAN